MTLLKSVLSSEPDAQLRRNFLILGILTIIFFHVRYGLGILNPMETAWLMKYDWAQHYMGWYSFRNDPWTFPLGNMYNLFYPIGTNVGFTDSIPLVAILLKPFSGLLPEQFQYFGPWLFIGHLLVALFSLKLLARLGIVGWAQLIAAALITFNPMLIYRAIHTALSSHWLIVANLWIYCLPANKDSRNKILLYQLILLLVGGLINPYFALINGGFLFILALKFWVSDKIFSFTQTVLFVFVSLLSLISSWLITGYFGLSNPSQLGVTDAYGAFAWNLSSLFNPFTYDRFYDFYTNNLSAFLPAHELVSWEQYESFSYLGLGLIILSIVCLFSLVGNPSLRTQLKVWLRSTPVLMLLLLTAALALFAISNKVSYNDHILFTFPLPGFFKLFTDIFRASARFIWVAYYLWLFFIVVVAARLFKRPKTLTASLAIIAVIQLVDIRPILVNRKLIYEPYKTKLTEPLWEKLIQATDAVLFLPPLQSNYLTHDDWQYFSFLAIKNKKPISVGHIARIDFTASQNFARKMLDQIAQRKLDSAAIYVMRPEYFGQFLTNYFSNKVDIVLLDGYLVVCPFNTKYLQLPEVLSEIKTAQDQQFVRERFQSYAGRPFPEQVPQENLHIKSGIYEIFEGAHTSIIRGWGFISGNPNFTVEILLKGPDGLVSAIPTVPFGTPDVADYFQDPTLVQSGFAGALQTDQLKNGIYQLGVNFRCTNEANPCTGQRTWIQQTLHINNPVDPVDFDWKESSDSITSDINKIEVAEGEISVEGWAFSTGIFPNEVFLTVSDDSRHLAFQTTIMDRPDVAAFYNQPRLIRSGFMVKFRQAAVPKGKYKLGFLFHDPARKRYLHAFSAKEITINEDGSLNSPAEETYQNATSLFFPEPTGISALPPTSESAKGFIDNVIEQKEYFKIEGWAYIADINDADSKIYLVLQSKDQLRIVPSKRRFRPDLASYFKHAFKTDSSGFELGLKKEFLDKGATKLSLLIENVGQSYVVHVKDSLVLH